MAQIEAVLTAKALQSFLSEVKEERIKELEIIQEHVELSLNELINKQNIMLGNFLERQQSGEQLSGQISQIETRLDDLNKRLEERRDLLKKEKEIAIGSVSHLGRAWVLPHPEKRSFAHMVSDPKIEKIGMSVATEYEMAHGREVQDVSSEDRGFDLLSKDPISGAARFIEVKGRSQVGDVAPTRNEHDTAQRLKKDYWLYAVFDCTTKPNLIAIQDPIAKLDWRPIVQIESYTITADSIFKAKDEGTE